MLLFSSAVVDGTEDFLHARRVALRVDVSQLRAPTPTPTPRDQHVGQDAATGVIVAPEGGAAPWRNTMSNPDQSEKGDRIEGNPLKKGSLAPSRKLLTKM